jgi:hypothetical protein
MTAVCDKFESVRIKRTMTSICDNMLVFLASQSLTNHPKQCPLIPPPRPANQTTREINNPKCHPASSGMYPPYKEAPCLFLFGNGAEEATPL